MITPTFLFALALLGNARAKILTIQVKPNQMFEEKFDAEFKITSAKLDNTDLKVCATPLAAPKTDNECYNQSETSKVHFIITNKDKYEEVQFTGKENAKATYTITSDGALEEKKEEASQQRAVTGNTIEETDFALPFVPEAMKLIPKKTANVKVNDGAADGPVEVTNSCTKTAEAPPEAKTNCFEVSKLLFPVTVKAKMESTDRILTLKGTGNEELTVTFKPKSSGGSSGNTGGSDSSTTSAAAWLSHSAALILSNLAMVYLLP